MHDPTPAETAILRGATAAIVDGRLTALDDASPFRVTIENDGRRGGSFELTLAGRRAVTVEWRDERPDQADDPSVAIWAGDDGLEWETDPGRDADLDVPAIVIRETFDR